MIIKGRCPPGGTPMNCWWGSTARFSKSWPKNVIFHTRFQFLPLKSTAVFRSGIGSLLVIITQIRRPTKRFIEIHFEIAYYSFFFNHLEFEMTNAFTHSRSYLENHTRFQTKMGKVDTRFQTDTVQKPCPLRQHTYITYIREYPLPRVDVM